MVEGGRTPGGRWPHSEEGLRMSLADKQVILCGPAGADGAN